MKRQSLYLVSDSSGNLLEHFFNAVLTQFPKRAFTINTLPFARTEEKVAESVSHISNGIVFHALRSSALKKIICRECEKRHLPSWDVTGPTADFLEKASGIRAARSPQHVHRVDPDYLSRIAALEFTMQHDDARRIEDIHRADIVLVGISRVSKSPNALFLAYRGFRVSNISIIPEKGLPEALERHRRKNVVALTLQPKRLAELRGKRFAKWKVENFPYEDLRTVIHEVMEAEKIYKKKGWPVIDTTDLAVEETSALILSALNLKPKVLE